VAAIRGLVALGAVMGVTLAAGCGGSSSPAGSTRRPASTAATTPAPRPQAVLSAYLRGVRVSLAAAPQNTTRATAALNALARHPSAGAARTAASSARAAARAAGEAAAAAEALSPPSSMHRATAALIGSWRLTAAGMRHLAGALDSWPLAGPSDGRERLDAAARRSLAWEGAARRAEQSARLPAWVSAQTIGAQALAHAAAAGLARLRFEPGSSGVTVAALQRRLAGLGYLPTGDATGIYDYRTMQAVIAFQGWEGLERDGIAGPITGARLQTARRPQPWSAATRHMELHVDRQVLLLVDRGTVVRAIHVSTAAPGHVTPVGTFRIYRKERMSWSVPFRVWMPYASYFTGGYALHEYPDVPPYPASHGCVRVPAGESNVVWAFATIGTLLAVG
jgi:hypothetical protein